MTPMATVELSVTCHTSRKKEEEREEIDAPTDTRFELYMGPKLGAGAPACRDGADQLGHMSHADVTR